MNEATLLLIVAALCLDSVRQKWMACTRNKVSWAGSMLVRDCDEKHDVACNIRDIGLWTTFDSTCGHAHCRERQRHRSAANLGFCMHASSCHASVALCTQDCHLLANMFSLFFICFQKIAHSLCLQLCYADHQEVRSLNA